MCVCVLILYCIKYVYYLLTKISKISIIIILNLLINYIKWYRNKV